MIEEEDQVRKKGRGRSTKKGGERKINLKRKKM